MKYNYIVTKNIPDEVIGFVGNNFLEDLLLFIISHFFQLLLDKARAVLIATEFNDVSVYFLYVDGPQATRVEAWIPTFIVQRLSRFVLNSSSSELRAVGERLFTRRICRAPPLEQDWPVSTRDNCRADLFTLARGE